MFVTSKSNLCFECDFMTLFPFCLIYVLKAARKYAELQFPRNCKFEILGPSCNLAQTMIDYKLTLLLGSGSETLQRIEQNEL